MDQQQQLLPPEQPQTIPQQTHAQQGGNNNNHQMIVSGGGQTPMMLHLPHVSAQELRIATWRRLQDVCKNRGIRCAYDSIVFKSEHRNAVTEKPYPQTEIFLHEEHPLDRAAELTKKGLYPLVMNAGDNEWPARGIEMGKGGAEEDLYRCTSYFMHVDMNMYPVALKNGDPAAVVYSPAVSLVFKPDSERYVELTSPASIGITMCSPVHLTEAVKKGKFGKKDYRTAKRRIRNLFSTAANYQHDSIILVAMGPGPLMRNPQEDMARIMKSVIEEYDGVFKEVWICVSPIDRDVSIQASGHNDAWRSFKKVFVDEFQQAAGSHDPGGPHPPPGNPLDDDGSTKKTVLNLPPAMRPMPNSGAARKYLDLGSGNSVAEEFAEQLYGGADKINADVSREDFQNAREMARKIKRVGIRTVVWDMDNCALLYDLGGVLRPGESSVVFPRIVSKEFLSMYMALMGVGVKNAFATFSDKIMQSAGLIAGGDYVDAMLMQCFHLADDEWPDVVAANPYFRNKHRLWNYRKDRVDSEVDEDKVYHLDQIRKKTHDKRDRIMLIDPRNEHLDPAKESGYIVVKVTEPDNGFRLEDMQKWLDGCVESLGDGHPGGGGSQPLIDLAEEDGCTTQSARPRGRPRGRDRGSDSESRDSFSGRSDYSSPSRDRRSDRRRRRGSHKTKKNSGKDSRSCSEEDSGNSSDEFRNDSRARERRKNERRHKQRRSRSSSSNDDRDRQHHRRRPSPSPTSRSRSPRRSSRRNNRKRSPSPIRKKNRLVDKSFSEFVLQKGGKRRSAGNAHPTTRPKTSERSPPSYSSEDDGNVVVAQSGKKPRGGRSWSSQNTKAAQDRSDDEGRKSDDKRDERRKSDNKHDERRKSDDKRDKGKRKDEDGRRRGDAVGPPPSDIALTREQMEGLEGLIYGQCIGDIVGSASQGMDKEEADECYGHIKDFIRIEQIPKDGLRSDYKDGEWTQLSDQMFVIIKTFGVSKGFPTPKSFVRTLVKWDQRGFPDANKKGSFADPHTKKLVDNPGYLKDPTKTARDVLEKSEDTHSNSVVVGRSAVLGIPEFHVEGTVTENAMTFSKTSHPNAETVAACVTLANVVSKIMLAKEEPDGRADPSAWISQCVEHGKEALGDEGDMERFEKCVDEGTTLEDLDLSNNKDGMSVLGAALWALRNTHDSSNIPTTLHTLMMEGGDAICNVAAAGSLLGCAFGVKSLPKEWIRGVIHKPFLSEEVSELKNASNFA